MIHPLDIILAILIAFLAREWFILRWPGEATEREELAEAHHASTAVGLPGAGPSSRSAASPVRQAGDSIELKGQRR